ncbi:MAG: nucleotide exchange factor GrpE [Proteobacteria bacterium]|nr:nucleotide exchange factor GrpE [Pseudomonadota bacterium]
MPNDSDSTATARPPAEVVSAEVAAEASPADPPDPPAGLAGASPPVDDAPAAIAPEPALSDAAAAAAEAAPQAAADPLAALQQQLTKTKDSWLRAAADLENYRRRARRDQLDAVRRAENEVVLLFLPVMDNVERAIGHALQAGGEANTGALLEGVRMVERQFAGVLARFAIEAQSTVGQPFDPQHHEAIQQQPSEQPPGTVVGELQKGYLRDGRLVRPALVVVSSGPGVATAAVSESAPTPSDLSTPAAATAATTEGGDANAGAAVGAAATAGDETPG